ncbi:homeodomain-interacting protein kinase 4 [Ascaphus truei]|uniref:homeodomain-interacting protein kinase 4 n=1 Tax=Ascaphus truei TaxID=8439 RepID=UPI003F5A01AF
MALLQSETDYYDMIEVLGKGTFGEVAKSWKRSTGQLVAIKILKNDVFRSCIIKNEIKLLKAMREVDPEESHIIHFYEYFNDDTKFYLVFELLEQNLFEYQKENEFAPLPIRHVRTITTQVLKALSKLKDLSIIHADLKPENIMLVDQAKYPFRVKVIDFGSASIFSEVRYVKEPYIQSRFYRSPEILLGLPFCEKVDMWSLGCIMAELQLGWPLYPGNNEYDQIRYICETQGIPKGHLLNAASKTFNFFKRNNSQVGTQWALKSAKEYQTETKVKPLERRKYILNSLDQIETVNVHKPVYPDVEILAEYYDLKDMVELVKRMLTWDSHERINPNAAMKHPFISLQQLMNYEPTKYYQLSLQCLHNSIKKEDSPYHSVLAGQYYGQEVPEYYQGENVQHMTNLTTVQRTIDQMDDLSIEEPRKEMKVNLWGEGAEISSYQPETLLEGAATHQDHACLHLPAYQANRPRHEQRREPVMAYYGSHRTSKHSKVPRHSNSDVTFANLILLGKHSPEDTISWEEEDRGSLNSFPSIAQESSAGEDHIIYKKPYSSPTVERAQTEVYGLESPVASEWPSKDDCRKDEQAREGHQTKASTRHKPHGHHHHYRQIISHH